MVNDFFGDEKPSKIKRAVIAGANEALKMKAKNWKEEDHEIIQAITKRVNEIVGNID